MTTTKQERMQTVLAELNANQQSWTQRFGLRLCIVPASQIVQTADGPRIEIVMRFGLEDVLNWTPPPPDSEETKKTEVGKSE